MSKRVKSDKDIIYGLRCCVEQFGCSCCPYDKDGCTDELMSDALSLVESLSVGSDTS